MGISTHILDTALGRPAADVPVTLAFWQSAEWVPLNSATTDADGRAKASPSCRPAAYGGPLPRAL